MQLPYQILAMDLDGTALGADPGQFAPDVLEAAQEAAEQGVTVVFATGRPATHLPPAVHKGSLPWLRYLVLNDGSLILDRQTEKTLWCEPVSETALDGVAQVSEHFGVAVEYIDAAGCYHVPEQWLQVILAQPEVSVFHKEVLRKSAVLFVGGASQFASDRILKINMPWVPPQQWQAVCTALEQAGVMPMACAPGALEITSPKAGKRAAVQFLAEQLDLTLADVMALGDSGNDLELLQSAGFGVAMENAPESIRAAADAVTAPNYESGAAKAIRKWLLGCDR